MNHSQKDIIKINTFKVNKLTKTKLLIYDFGYFIFKYKYDRIQMNEREKCKQLQFKQSNNNCSKIVHLLT